MTAARAPEFRLPSTTRLGPVHLQVADLGRSIAYYEQIIGLRTLERSGDAARLAGATDGDALVDLQARPGARPIPRHGRLGLYHFAILLPDRRALGRFVAHLARGGQRLAAADHAVSEAIYLSDPDGLGIEVYADRPRDTWRFDGGEIHMVSEPLDLDDLVAAGGGAAWDGAPSGTTIGHVHLHVGDLAQGRAFYHGALGFDVTVSSYPGALFLSAGGYHHHLGTNTWAAAATPAAPDEARLLEWHVALPDAVSRDRAAASLAAASFEVERNAEGDVVSRDPWGTQVRLRARG